MRKLSLIVILIFAASILTGGFVQRHALACELLPVLNNQEFRSNAFLVSEFSVSEVETLNGVIDAVAERMSETYGTPDSTPRFVITRDELSSRKWGANETASMHRMPWRSCIVVGPQGQNVDVLAHEWLHAEIQHRVGFFRFLMEIPVWFDEGSALTLDYREPFLPNNIDLSSSDIEEVKDMHSGRLFFSGHVRRNYQAARMAVAPLIQHDSFYSDLDRIGAGDSFEAVFLNNKSVERSTIEELDD